MTDTKRKHTPGPWYVSTTPRCWPHGAVVVRQKDPRSGIVVCCVMTNIPYRDEDAHLIAAAGTAASECEENGYDGLASIEALPKLLKALSMIVGRREIVCALRNTPERLDGSDGRYADARAALAQARGEAPDAERIER